MAICQLSKKSPDQEPNQAASLANAMNDCSGDGVVRQVTETGQVTEDAPIIIELQARGRAMYPTHQIPSN
jgi:hypothetical protein